MLGEEGGTEGNQIFNFFIVHRNGLSGPRFMIARGRDGYQITGQQFMDPNVRYHSCALLAGGG